MKAAIIISGILFTIGNAVYRVFIDDPKIVWVPLSIFLFLLILYVWEPGRKIKGYENYFLSYLLLLASGNIVKQVFYTEKIKQINDYVWGGFITLWLLIMIIKWAIRKQRRGNSSGSKQGRS